MGKVTPKILLAEDDTSLGFIVADQLKSQGYEVTLASDGAEAFKRFNEGGYHICILDVMMPKVSGFDVLDILRNTPETANMQVIMLTALSQESDKKKAEDLGVDDYLVKSQVVIADVVDRVKTRLGIV